MTATPSKARWPWIAMFAALAACKNSEESTTMGPSPRRHPPPQPSPPSGEGGEPRGKPPSSGGGDKQAAGPRQVSLETMGHRGTFRVDGVACAGDDDELSLQFVADCPSYGPEMVGKDRHVDQSKLTASCPQHKLIAVAFSDRPKGPGSYGDIRTLAIVVSGGDGRFAMTPGRQRPGKGVVFTELSDTIAEGRLDVQSEDGDAITLPLRCTIERAHSH